jgi:tol-pal system protein YbgF
MRSHRFLGASFVALVLFSGTPAIAQDATELLLRIDRLEAENRRLNGSVEQMQFQIERLETTLKKLQADIDLRFDDIEGGKAPAKRPAQQSDAEEPAPKKQAAAEPEIVTDEPAAPPADNPAAENPSAKTPASSGDLLADGNAALEQERYADAEVAFRAFLKDNPKGKGASEAMFGLGESLYLREQYADAAEHYLNLTNQFPKANRAAESLLRLGMSLNQLGARVEACSTYDEVGKKYPGASTAVKEAVKRQRTAAKCS